MKTLVCESIVPQYGLRIGPYNFTCPYCTRQVHRGGKAEGFRKAGFAMHVAQCWEILVFQAGYLPGSWNYATPRGHIAISIASPPADHVAYVDRRTKAIKAHIRKRKREGFTPRV